MAPSNVFPKLVSPCPSVSSFSKKALQVGPPRDKELDYLPSGYTPGPFEVIVGRGRKVTNHHGNKILRVLLQQELPAYTRAAKKPEKTQVISRILDQIRSQTDIGWGFVKRESSTNRWFVCNEILCRSTIAQLFRDSLSDCYRSSRQAKLKRRKQREKVLCLKDKTVTLTDAFEAATKKLLESNSLPVNLHERPQDESCPKVQRQSDPVIDDKDIFDALFLRTGTFEATTKQLLASNPFSVNRHGSLPDKSGQTVQQSQPSNDDKDLFNALFLGFGYNQKEGDPFEPTPISPKLGQILAMSAQ